MNKHEITGDKQFNDLTLLRIDKDMSSMNEQQFVGFMRESVQLAQNEYNEIMTQYNIGYLERSRECERKRLYHKYDKKLKSYKRESSRQQVIDMIEKQLGEYSPRPYRSDIFFDLMPVCHDNSIDTREILDTDSTDRAYEFIYDKYEDMIHRSRGLVFRYQIHGTNEITPYSFRPWVEFILPEDEMNMLREENRKTHEAIQRFYDSLNYKGD